MSADDTRTAGSEADDGERQVGVDEAVAIALGMIKKGRFRTAGEVLDRVLAVSPGHADALNYRGVTHYHLDGAQKSIEFLTSAAEIAPGHGGIRNNLGNALIEAGDIDAAMVAYQQAIEFNPALPDPYCNLASIMKHTGDVALAEKLLRKALQIDPEFGLANRNLAALLLDTKRPREAIDYFWKATVHFPEKALSAHLLALAYWFGGLKDTAIKFVRNWAETNPNDVEVQHLLASMTGENVPERASDLYVRRVFDAFANSFDAKLESLDYKAPELVGVALKHAVGDATGGLNILDAGCGTGRCAKHLRPHARSLTGVDLSGGMLFKADKLGAYDMLEQAELTQYLASKPERFDVVVSADTLCYFGLLEDFAGAAASALRGGGSLVFTVEALEEGAEERYRLAVNGRYAHGEAYVRRTLEDAGFSVVGCAREILRSENCEPVAGLVVVARRNGRGK